MGGCGTAWNPAAGAYSRASLILGQKGASFRTSGGALRLVDVMNCGLDTECWIQPSNQSTASTYIHIISIKQI